MFHCCLFILGFFRRCSSLVNAPPSPRAPASPLHVSFPLPTELLFLTYCCQDAAPNQNVLIPQSLGDLSAVGHVEGSAWVFVFCIRGTGQGRGVVGPWAGGDIITAAVAALIRY